jgi:hypothetical protein
MRQGDERLHQRVWDLLPWYANGTLEEGERWTVEEHAAGCERCRGELESCRQLGEAVRRSEEAAPSPHPARLARLMDRLDESSSFAARLRGLFAVTPGPVRWVLAAQLAALLLLVAGWSWTRTSAPPAPQAAYRTLSDPAPQPSSTVRVRVVFAEDATERQIRGVLLAIGGQLAGGPSPLGAYTVELPAGQDPLPVVLAHLRNRPEVSFAEPVAP